jgi:hypothetical protein
MIIMTTIGGSIKIQQEEADLKIDPENGPVSTEDVAIPLIGGEMGMDEVKANFNALLYLQTEQMAVMLKIIDFLVKKDIGTAEEMNEEILGVTGDQNQLTAIYNEMFSRFVGYYSSLRRLMADGKIFKADATVDISDQGEQDV